MANTATRSPSPAGRRPRARAVTAYYSTTATEPKLHLDIRCTGLERVPVWPDCSLAHEHFASVQALARSDRGRPCRVCALESVLDVMLRPRGASTEVVFATFTSQGCPHESLARFRWRESTESGAERLVRLADRLEVPTVRCANGPVAWGFFPRDGIATLQRNLRTYEREDVIVDPGETAIQTLWSFLDDAPVELEEPDTQRPDPLELATLLSS